MSREIAEGLARNAGLSLREWLDSMIEAEEGPEEAVSQDIFKPRSEAGYVETPRPPERGPARMEAFDHPADEVSRVARALEQLTSRIEQAERSSTAAIAGVEQSVYGVIARMEAAEREQTAVAARFEGALQDIRADQQPIVERVRRIELEAQGPRSAEALKSLEGALGKVAAHLYDGEARTRESLDEMRARLERSERERMEDRERAARLDDADRAALDQARETAGQALSLVEDLGAVVRRTALDPQALVEQITARVSARADTAMAQVASLSEEVRRNTPDPQSLVEQVVAQVGERLAQAEGQTTAALEALQSSFAGLDERLRTAEAKDDGGAMEARLESLAASLSDRLDAARAEMSEGLTKAAAGRFDRMESALAEMSGHVAAAEKRSAEAMERMGREVLTMAETLNRRVAGVESRSAESLQHMGGEMSRIAASVESRLARADASQAQALEKLGGEIARITERLVERIANSERRSAQAMDDVGEQVARVSERLGQRQERTSADLLERIRQSEERTARLLDEAREKIDSRLSEAQRRIEEAVAPPPAAVTRRNWNADAFAPFEEDDDAFVSPAFAPQALSPQAFSSQPLGRGGFEPITEPTPAPAYEPPEEDAPPAVFGRAPAAAPAEIFDHEPDAPAVDDVFVPVSEPRFTAPAYDDPDGFDEDPFAVDDPFAPKADPSDEPSNIELMDRGAERAFGPSPTGFSTKSLIEQARATVRPDAAQADDEAPLKVRKRVRVGPSPKQGLFSGLRQLGKGKKRKGGSTVQAAVVMAAIAAVGGGVASYALLDVAEPSADANKGALETAPAAPPPAPRAAVALDPQPIGPTAPAGATTAPGAVDPAALYVDAVARVEAKSPTGLADLKRVANLGYAPAQFYLAKLYESGSAGLTKDMIEARRWTERAAQGGDRKAMHNLALYYFEGVGGDKNTATAAQWFRRAADLGLVDSQYNLGRLYEEGFGVSQNAAEAYKWYLIASKSGDAESKTSAERAKSKLTPAARAAAERSAAGFRANVAGGSAPTATAAASATPQDVTTAQKALSQLGYYQGPADGRSSPALRMAIGAYQRDQGLSTTGVLDATLVTRLEAFAR